MTNGYRDSHPRTANKESPQRATYRRPGDTGVPGRIVRLVAYDGGGEQFDERCPEKKPSPT
jgi:hypothetical protein